MTPAQFAKLLEMVQPLIQKKDTVLRNCIGPAERLQVTLRYLATGESQYSLQLPFRIHQSTISKILKETIPAIYKVLKDECLKFPQRSTDWEKISKDFYSVWGFPNCIGAVDGKHCKIRAMKSAGSTYFNYKGDHSIILMAIADAHYRFIYVDVGVNGRVGDAGVWLHSDLKYAIEDNKVNIPAPCILPNSDRVSPYTFIADDAFALTDYMLKPYSHTNLSRSEHNFNYMLSRNRRVVESAFGILANRFQVLFSPIFRTPTEAAKVVLACVALHNFLRNDAINSDSDDITGSWDELERIVDANYSNIEVDARHVRSRRTGESVREGIKEYLVEQLILDH